MKIKRYIVQCDGDARGFFTEDGMRKWLKENRHHFANIHIISPYKTTIKSCSGCETAKGE